MKKFAIVIAVLAMLLAIPATSQAGWLHMTWQQRMHHVHHHHKPVKHTPAPPKHRTVRYETASDQADCFTPGWDAASFMQAHHANVYRMITTAYHVSTGEAKTCADNVHKANYPLYVSLGLDPNDSIATDESYVQQTLQAVGPVWAFSLGNEMDAGGNGWYTPQDYVTMWNAVIPTVEQMDPGALRAFGEVTPWAWKWLEQAVSLEPTSGYDAASFHPYYTAVPNDGLVAVPKLAAYIAQYGKPLWCSEEAPDLGTDGPPWVQQQTLPEWEQDNQQNIDSSPNLEMVSWYHWLQFGAN